MKPRVAFANDKCNWCIDGLTRTQIADHLNSRPHFSKDDVLLVHDRFFNLRVFGFANGASKFRAVERIKKENDAGGTGDMLCAGLLHDVDAGLKVLAGVVIKYQCALLPGLVLRCERVNKGARESNHSTLARQTFIHRAFKDSLC